MSGFPDASSKTGASVKKSIFERQKEEAEAKRIREQAETAAVLEEFTKSFDDDGYTANHSARGPPPPPGKRHFTNTGLKSGPGSLGSAPTPKSGPGSLGPAFGKKRHYDDYNDRRESRGGLVSREDRKASLNDDEERAAAKPTVQLSSLPPATSPAVIKNLLAPTSLVVENVRILPSPASNGQTPERRSITAIVTLAAETPAADVDAAVSQLQNKYLGLGFNLSITRHLSSTALTSLNITSGTSNELPFGAKFVQQHQSLSRAPPPNQRFAPPSSYTPSAPYTRTSTQVTVQFPSDLTQLKLIHKTLEALLTYGPEFEALLMSRPEIQQDEKWAWLWNSRSTGGVYYRWRLWAILTDGKARRKHGRQGNESLFEGQSIWQPPEEALRFEYTTNIDEFVSDEDYNSSDEEEDDDGGIAARYNDHNASGPNPEDVNEGKGYLNPLARAKLTHLLSRLPDSTSKLRRGDIARITAFAIEHAGSGAAEVAQLITRNVIKPFNGSEDEDTTSSSHVGLYVISDILSSSASAGVRHAWRYRTLFESITRQQGVWEKLGRAEKDHAWGKLKAEKWKRSMQSLFSLWEGWSVFQQATQEEIVNKFLNPPLTEAEQGQAESEEKRKAEDEAKRVKSINRWRSVDEEKGTTSDIEMKVVDGVAREEGNDMDYGTDDNIDGVPMADSSDEEEPVAEAVILTVEENSIQKATLPADQPKVEQLPAGKRQRPRAADMFADDSP